MKMRDIGILAITLQFSSSVLVFFVVSSPSQALFPGS